MIENICEYCNKAFYTKQIKSNNLFGKDKCSWDSLALRCLECEKKRDFIRRRKNNEKM